MLCASARVLTLVMLIQMYGCASIVNGQNQSVSVVTPGCTAASCELNNDKGKWYIPSTPGSVTVNRSFADLFVRCTKGDLPPVIQSVQSKTKGMAFGNILLGGVIGAGVDIANGSAYDYPPEISLPFACDTSAQKAAMPPLRLGCKVKELAEIDGGVAGFSGTQGVVVISVEAGSLAESGGIQAGDLLVEFNEVQIENSIMLKDVLLKHDPHQAFRIKYFRQGQYQWAEFKTARREL